MEGNWKQAVLDTVMKIGKAIVFAVLAYLYWCGLLFILSIFLMNIWRVTWEEILIYALVLSIVTIVIKLLSGIWKRRR